MMIGRGTVLRWVASISVGSVGWSGPSHAQQAQDESGWYPNDEVGYLNLDVGLRANLAGGVTTTSVGPSIELGFNLARMFEPATVVSIYGGFAVSYGGDYVDGFQEDLRANETGSSAAFDRVAWGDAQGGVNLYYGLMLRYPHRYMPVLKLYRVHGSTETGRYVRTGYVTGSATGSHWMDRVGWGAEVVAFRGYTLVSAEGFGAVNLGYVSLFVETLDMQGARIEREGDGTTEEHLRDYVAPSFFDEWGRETVLGVKVGCNVL